MVDEIVHGALVLNQSSGRLEADESLLEAALRETLAETAWTVELTGLLGIYQWRSPTTEKHYLGFAFTARLRSHDARRTTHDANSTKASSARCGSSARKSRRNP
jgi:ADP-ribose pyrophosphatase YjhB (NUDIX family)